jgi:hypothetical protein
MSLEGLFQQRLEDPSSDAHADRPAAGREHGGAPLPARVGAQPLVRLADGLSFPIPPPKQC